MASGQLRLVINVARSRLAVAVVRVSHGQLSSRIMQEQSQVRKKADATRNEREMNCLHW